MKNFFSPDSKQAKEDMDRLMKLYTDEVFEEFMEDPKCSECGKPATQRCSKCKQAWYCSRDCQLRHWKAHKAVCALFKAHKDENSAKEANKTAHEKEKANQALKKNPLIEVLT